MRSLQKWSKNVRLHWISPVAKGFTVQSERHSPPGADLAQEGLLFLMVFLSIQCFCVSHPSDWFLEGKYHSWRQDQTAKGCSEKKKPTGFIYRDKTQPVRFVVSDSVFIPVVTAGTRGVQVEQKYTSACVRENCAFTILLLFSSLVFAHIGL